MQIEKISQNQFTVMVEMLFTLLQKGIITRAEADKTAQRIASQNELTFIYLW
ncbi:hypothetical protein [Pygmaiobacter massiliensis]|uniref:hypothetical protein n=1 Tax=Pygmaiobacter massiliensis TaxID=1917873 RepID=UPI0028A0212D|nr:hypothetical protein [Pygmaiobacter massiliensis]